MALSAAEKHALRTNNPNSGNGLIAEIDGKVDTPTSPTTFTQTYSTANTTVAAATSHAITDGTGGVASTTALANLADGSTYANDHAALENNLATLAAEDALMKADILALAKNINAIIDALQAAGIVG